MEACRDRVPAVLVEASGVLLTSDTLFFRSLGSLGPGRLTQKVSKTCEP